MKMKSLFFGIAMALPAFATGAAQAADVLAEGAEQASCGCVQPLPTDGGPVGSVVSASSDVLVSLPAGMTPARAGTPLDLGTRLIVGPAGAATINVGRGCRLAIPAESTVEIAAQQGAICVRSASVAGGPQGTPLIPGVSNGLLAGIVGVGAIGGVIAIVASGDDDNSDTSAPVSLGR